MRANAPQGQGAVFETGRLWGSLSACLISGVLVTSFACSDDDDDDNMASLADLGIDDGASAGESESALVNADAPTMLILKTGARLDIPQGSVTKQLKVDLTRPADSTALPLLKMVGSEFKVASAPYVVTPHGATFEKDLELTLPINKGNTSRLVVAYLEDEQDTSWEVHSMPKISGNTAKIQVRHFSVYVLLEQSAASADAGLADGSTADAGTTGTYPQRAAARLGACGYVAQSGLFDEDYVPRNDAERCEVECMLDAACPDVEAFFCSGLTPSDAFVSCTTRCHSYSVVECETALGPKIVSSCDARQDCLDGSDEANCPAEAFLSCLDYDGKQVPVARGCDGNTDCRDGTDELDCPAGTHFICESGERVSSRSRCDGFSNCGDASDEAGCAEFSCADGAQVVPAAVVCDLQRDCSDGSDEDQGCLKLTCEPSLGGDNKMLSRPVRTVVTYQKQPRNRF